jgi:2-polyprenyl-6-methoxyphenol hydroxylase-like FAD-dependent oxidoreductase
MRKTDIAIVGGGLAGSMTAAMLQRAGRDFVMVDPDPTYPWDFRCEKLDSSQVTVLRKAGLADIVLPSATLFDQLWIARLGRFVQKRANEQYGIFYDALVNRFRAEIPPERFTVGKVASIAASSDRQSVVLSDGSEISARLVVLATGPNHALRTSLGIERHMLSPCHSISIGFDMKPADKTTFDFPALTYFPDRPSDPIAYLTLFPIGGVMRANLFVYYEARDPWLGKFREAPQAMSFAAMPGLRSIIGDFEITSAVKVRPIDLYETSGHRQAGVVLVGDAFSSSCPAAGTGANKVVVDVERLCAAYIPRWLSTEGMGAEKIGAFYDDPDKRASDEQSMAKANWLRSVSMSRTVRWRARRLLKFVSGYGRGALDLAKEQMRVRS